MSVSVNVIEHITDDAYNRQEEFREKDQISLLERGKTKGEKSKSQLCGLVGRILLSCTIW